MKAKIKKGLTFFTADGRKITVSTVDIKTQLVYYTVVEATGEKTDHINSLPKKQFEAWLAVGLEVNPNLFKQAAPVSSDANQMDVLKAQIETKYRPDPSKAIKGIIATEPLDHLPTPNDLAWLSLDLQGKNKFKMVDGSKWSIKDSFSQVLAENLETGALQEFKIPEFNDLLTYGHVVLF